MPIKIHHGPNGSFKTSGAVWDDAVQAMKEGRVIITNVRGMSAERCRSLFPDLPDTFDLFNIDTDTEQGLLQARTWFHWVPRGAFLIFDEPQIIFLKSWTDSALKQFDFPGGSDAAGVADRPANFLDAWTRHRHWNWDVVLCTPNIRYMRDDIRLTSEMAYLHTNLAVLGKFVKVLLRADYKEVMHSAQDNKPAIDGTIVKFKKIDSRVFQLYDSTATGQHRDTFTGQSLFASPKVLGCLGFLAIVLAFIYYRTGFSLATDGLPAAKSPPVAQNTGTPTSSSHAQAAAVATGDTRAAVANQPAAVTPPPGPFDALEIAITAALQPARTDPQAAREYWYRFELSYPDGSSFALGAEDLQQSGYQVRPRGQCAAEIIYIYTLKTRLVTCKGFNRTAPQAAQRTPERERSSAGAGASIAVSQPVLAVGGR